MNLDNIRKINKDLIKDGRILSFKEQIFDLMTGSYDPMRMMIISDNTNFLSYIDNLDTEKILTVNPNKILQVMTEHNLSLKELADFEKLLKNSVMAMDSLTQESSRVIVLDKLDIKGNNMIAICRLNAENSSINVNQITSIYGKKNFETFIERTFNSGKNIYINEKTKEFVETQGFQLPNRISNSLYDNRIGILNKSQEKIRKFDDYIYKDFGDEI